MHATRESIFVGAIRSFCVCFAAILGIAIAFILIFIGISSLSGPNLLPEKSDMQILPDASGETEVLSSSFPAILRIDIHGVIGEKDLTTEKIEQILRDSRDDYLKNNRVKAILLHMDTPGGEATNADGIYRALMTYKQKYQVPIYVYVEGLCASGGMYIASAADKIYACPTSVIGSVGIILGPTFNFSGVMDKIGVQSLTITEGKDKDMLNPFRPWVPGEDASLKDITTELYERFVSIVSNARPKLTKEKLIDDYGAQVYVSPKAEELGYIDNGASSYVEALTDLTKSIGIEAGQKYQVVQLQTPQSFFSQLASGKSSLLSGKITHTFQIGPNLSSELSGKFLYLYQPIASP